MNKHLIQASGKTRTIVILEQKQLYQTHNLSPPAKLQLARPAKPLPFYRELTTK